ncbi:hypothetical protein BH09SUM1_BH09SUM1_05430 [soil metagenome]
MRTRPLVLSLLLTTSSAFLLAGCSGKPENSPAIRQKFAAFDQSQKNVEQIALDVQSLKDQVAQLSQENSELRALTANTTPAAGKSKAASTDVQASAAKHAGAEMTSPETAALAPKSTDLEQAGLAGVVPATEQPKKTEAKKAATATTPGAKTVLAQQQTTKPAATASNSFKSMTSGAKTTKPAAKEVATAAVKGTTPKATSYHTIAAGDSIASISTKYGVSSDAIVKANHIPTGARLALGQKLYIPKN